MNINTNMNFASGSAQRMAPHEDIREDRSKTLAAKVLRRLLFVDLFLIFFGAPVFFSAATLQGISFDRIMFLIVLVLLAFALWVIQGAYNGQLRIVRTPIDIVLLVFWATYLLATIFSGDRWHSFIGQFIDPSRGLLLLTAFIFLYYIIGSTQSRRNLHLLFAALAASLGVHAFWGAFVLYGGLSLFSEQMLRHVPIILTDSFPSQAFIAAIGIPVLAATATQALFPGKRPMLRRIVSSLAALALLADVAVLAALYVFAPWVALLVGTGFFAAYLMGNIVLAPKGWQWVGAATFLIIVALLMLGPGLLARVAPNTAPSRHYIRDAWEITKTSVPEHFFFGVGPGMYGHAFSEYYPAQWNLSPNLTTRFSYAPDVLLGSVVTTGIIGTAALLVLIVMVIGVGVYFLIQRDKNNRLLSLAAWAAVITVLAISIFFSIRATVMVIAGLLSVLAMTLILRESSVERKSITVSLRTKPQYALASSFAFMVAGVGVVFLFVFIAKTIAADVYAGRAARSADMTRDDRAALFGKAIGLNKREGYYYLYAGSEYFAKAYAMLLEPEDQRDTATIQQTLRVALQFLERGRDLLPGNVTAQTLLAQAYETLSPYAQDGPSAGRDAYVRASDMEPSNPLYHVKTAELALFEARGIDDEQQKNALLDEAQQRLERAIELDEAHYVAYDDLGRTYEVRGDLDKAIESFEKALQYGRNIQSALDLARAYQTRGEGDDLQRAENVLVQIIGVSDKEINAHLGLAGLYERTSRPAEAIDEYKKAKDLLPENSDNARKQIDELISKLESGGSVTGIPESDAEHVMVPAANEESAGETNATVPVDEGANPTVGGTKEQGGTTSPQQGQ